MAIKTHKVTLSLDNPRVIQSGINVQSFDKQSIQISIELTKNDEVFQVPSDATIRVSLLKLARQEQRIIVDVPNTNRDSIDWIVPDYLDGYQGTVRVGVYLVSGAENVDLGYFTILSNVSDIDKMADEFTDNVFQGWEQIEADLNELNLTIAQTKLDLAEDLTQIDNTIANINTLASDFTTDVATKQTDVTNKYNAFDASVTTANQTIDDILALQPQFQSVLDETTGKDVISAPEIILARGGATTLGERLDSEKAEVTAQLAQTENEVDILSTKEVNINSYSALAVNEISDGIMDWTNAINTAISEMGEGDTLVLPNNHIYGTTDTILVNKVINIIGNGDILSHHEGVGILFYPASGKLMHMDIDISLEKKKINWDSGSVGVLIRDAYYSTFKLRKVNNFTKNLLLEPIKLPSNSSGAVTYCRFFIDEMNNHKEGITFKSRLNIGWVTENSFYGGSLGNGYGISEEGIHVVFDSDSPGWNNNNKFFGMSFEGHYSRAVKGTETSNNVFHACRFEMPYMTTSIEWTNSGCQLNAIRDGYGVGAMLLESMIDNGRYNIVSGATGSAGRFEYYDRKVYQFITGVTSPMRKYENFESIPVGKNAYIKVYPVDGVLTIDLKSGTEFDVYFGSVETVINEINVINKPNSPNGMEFNITFNQSSVGASVLDLPGEVTDKPLPVNRPYGKDLYTFKYIGEVGNFLLCVNHTAR